jgi:quaternary ammonium compound-resistance protein SugE
MAWMLLLVAGLFEIGWAIGLKYTQGFTRPVASVLTIIAIVISMTLLAFAVRTIPVGTGYAIWTGIGAVGTAALGIWLFHEPATPARLFFLAMIIVGIVGLKFSAGAADDVPHDSKQTATMQ